MCRRYLIAVNTLTLQSLKVCVRAMHRVHLPNDPKRPQHREMAPAANKNCVMAQFNGRWRGFGFRRQLARARFGGGWVL
jgi:hypothetical protein